MAFDGIAAFLYNLPVQTKQRVARIVKQLGGSVHVTLNKNVTHLITTDNEIRLGGPKIRAARAQGISVVPFAEILDAAPLDSSTLLADSAMALDSSLMPKVCVQQQRLVVGANATTNSMPSTLTTMIRTSNNSWLPQLRRLRMARRLSRRSNTTKRRRR